MLNDIDDILLKEQSHRFDERRNVHSLLKGQSSRFYQGSSYADFNRTIIHFLVKEQSCELIE